MEEREQGMVLDIGGGSTEWVCFSQGRIRHAASIPLGSLNLYNRCVETLLPSPKEQAKIRKQVKKALDGAPLPDFPCPVICGVGGTIRGAGKLCNYLYKLPAGNRTITLNMDGLGASPPRQGRTLQILPRSRPRAGPHPAPWAGHPLHPGPSVPGRRH